MNPVIQWGLDISKQIKEGKAAGLDSALQMITWRRSRRYELEFKPRATTSKN